jgi:hypothetical protein
MINNKIGRQLLGMSCILGLFLTVGCYHATIDTGLAPGVKTTKVWAHSWVYGLVPPSVVNAQSECENGVAKVETQLTFVNQLVSGLTFGIYTPMEISVTCAASGSSDANADSSSVVKVSHGSDYAQVMDAFKRASDMAVSLKQPVFVQFESIDL